MMQIDRQTFIADYVVEALDYLDSLDDLCLRLNTDNRDEDSLKEVQRILHTLKGSSRMMEFSQIERTVNALEAVFKKIQSNKTEVQAKIIQLLLNTGKCIRRTVEKIQESPEDEESARIQGFDLIVSNIQKAADGLDYSVEFSSPQKKITETQAEQPEEELFHDSETIKVQVSQINSILQDFDKLIMRQIRLKNQISCLKNKAGLKDLQGMQELDENTGVLEAQSLALQEKIIELRMLPFDMILQPIKRSIITEALKLEKNIDFDIPHSEITIDKSILERLPKILVHLVRNAVDHGIESTQERKKAGKNEKGSVSIAVTQVSSRIFVTVSDDGRGIDYERIRAKAVQKYPDRTKEIEGMDKDSLLQFLFVSGFSTKDKQTELSGLGIGMDVVRTEMDKLKGKIHIDSVQGEGTSIELSLPASLATQDGLYIRVGEAKYLILSHYIKEIVPIKKRNVIELQHGPVINLHKELIPLYDFDSITGKISKVDSHKNENSPVVVIEYLNRKIAVITDQILNYATVVIKPLPPVLKSFEALQGIVFDENYSIIPVLNIPDAMRRFKTISAYDVKNLEVHKQRKIYSVLIADDSNTTRHIEKIILEAENYKVSTACDGIEALEKLKSQHFDLVVTDVKMPRMDGFTLIQNIRHIESLKKLPVIVISSVFENDTLKIVRELGAEYIVKSDFERESLVAKAKELLNDE